MIEAMTRRTGIGFIITAMLSELLKERAHVFDRLDDWGDTRCSGKWRDG